MGRIANGIQQIQSLGRRLGSLTTVAKAAVRPTTFPEGFGYVREPYAGAWQNGESQQPALGAMAGYGSVYACVARISNDIAKLQPELLVQDSNGIPELAPSNSPFWRVLKKPNQFQNRIQFIMYWMALKLLHGNAYALKLRETTRGMVVALHLLDPRKVVPFVTPEGDVYYSLSGDELSKIPTGMLVPASEIIHDRDTALWHPLMGVPRIVACAQSVMQGLRIQGSSSKFFQNMSRPSGMLTAPGTIDNVTAQRLKTEWEANYSGNNIGRLAVLGDGLKYEAMTIPAEQAQLIEQLSWTVEDVARCFSVPLYKINAGPMPTAGNVEALESQYYSGCLQILIESFELCMAEGLGIPDTHEVMLNLDGLLRMDSATHIEMLAKAVGGAIMKPDEARRARRLKPIPGGDAVYLQQQNYSLAALAKRDAREDPFAPAKPPAPPTPPAPSGEDAPDAPDGADAPDQADQEEAQRQAAIVAALVESQLKGAREREELMLLGALASRLEQELVEVAA